MTKKQKIKSVSNSKHFLILKIDVSDTIIKILQRFKEEIYQDDEFILTMMEKEKNRHYDDLINTHEMIKEDLIIFYYKDWILIIIAKSSKLFKELKEKIMRFFK